MPDIKQTLQNLKAKGRVQGPAQPKKLDRSGKPRRPDEHLKRSVEEALEADEQINSIPSVEAPPPEPTPLPPQRPIEEVEARATERRLSHTKQVASEPATPKVSIAPEKVEPKPIPRTEIPPRQGAERSQAETPIVPPQHQLLTLVAESAKQATTATPLPEGGRELAAITRLLRADTCYYLAFLEMRDPSTGIVDLPHLTYAELFAVRKNTIAPMIKRLIDAGALTVERAYDAGTRTTWAYRVTERQRLAERAPAPGAL